MNERWLPVVGYERFYSVSSLGRVRSEGRFLPRSHGPYVMAPRIMRPGGSRVSKYLSVRLVDERGIASTHYVHALVLTAFVSVRPPGLQACHNNGVRTDNRVENLRWDTVTGNTRDKLAHGTTRRGEQHHGHKLTERDVREIRGRVRSGASQRSLCAIYGVGAMTISRAVRGESWSHVK